LRRSVGRGGHASISLRYWSSGGFFTRQILTLLSHECERFWLLASHLWPVSRRYSDRSEILHGVRLHLSICAGDCLGTDVIGPIYIAVEDYTTARTAKAPPAW